MVYSRAAQVNSAQCSAFSYRVWQTRARISSCEIHIMLIEHWKTSVASQQALQRDERNRVLASGQLRSKGAELQSSLYGHLGLRVGTLSFRFFLCQEGQRACLTGSL